MGLPAHRTTNSKRDMRRAHHALSVSNPGKCVKCGSPVLGHKACGNCGFYKGKEVVNVLARLDKKEKKKKEKELASQKSEKEREHKE